MINLDSLPALELRIAERQRVRVSKCDIGRLQLITAGWPEIVDRGWKETGSILLKRRRLSLTCCVLGRSSFDKIDIRYIRQTSAAKSMPYLV